MLNRTPHLHTTAIRVRSLHRQLTLTNAPDAGIFTLMTRTHPERGSPQGVTAFIVERDLPSITIKLHRPEGRTHSRCDVLKLPRARLADCRRQESLRFKTAMKLLEKGRINLAGDLAKPIHVR